MIYITQKKKDLSHKILELLLQSKEITRLSLAGALGASPSTIGRYIQQMERDGIVQSTGELVAQGKRSAQRLALNPGTGVNLAIFVQKSFLFGGVINFAGQILCERRIILHNSPSQTQLLHEINEMCALLSAATGEMKRRAVSLSIAIGGHLDIAKGELRRYSLIPGWKPIYLAQELALGTQFPIFILNDVDALTMGEKYYGEARDLSNFVTLWLGETVGMSLVANGQICQGMNGMAGDFGHLLIKESQELCYCGHKGCLETLVNSLRALEIFRCGVSSGAFSALAPATATIEELVGLSNQGDNFAQEIFIEMAEILGPKLADFYTVFCPERIFLGGSLGQNNRIIIQWVDRAIKRRWRFPCNDAPLVESLKGNEGLALQGAASHGLRSSFFWG